MLQSTDADPTADRFTLALQSCRQFLLSVANAEMPDQLIPKGGASDLVQETMMKAHTAREEFQGETLADLRAWLRAILRNEIAAFRRRFHTAIRDVDREVPLPAESGPAPEPEPADQLVRAERAEAVAAAVDRLPKDAQQVILLRIELRLSFREIGERLGRTEDAARKVFGRALEQLRQITRERAG